MSERSTFRSYYDISHGPGEAHRRGRAAGAVLQVRVRVLRGVKRGRGRRGPLPGGRGCQVRARAVLATGCAAAPRRVAAPQGQVRAARGGGAGAVGAGRRAAGVAAALRGRHGGVRGRARGLHRGAGLGAARGSAGRGAVRGHGLLPGRRVAARGAARAGAGLRAAAGHDGLARRGARRGGGAGRAAVPAVGRHPRLQPVRRPRALPAGAGDVHVLPGAAGHRAECAVGGGGGATVSACDSADI